MPSESRMFDPATHTWDPSSASRVHVAQFYDNEVYLQRAAADFLAHAIQHREPAVMVSRPSTYEAVMALTGAGSDIRFVNVQDALRQFMHAGMPDPVRFEQSFEQLLRRIDKPAGSGRIWIFGEIAGELSRSGNHAAAVRVEELWNTHFSTPAIAVMCGYQLSGFDNDADSSLVRKVCRQHTDVVPADSFADAPDERKRLELVAVLQQRARVLDRLLAREAAPAESTRPPVSTIYIVDDDPSIRRSLARLLGTLNMRVQTFESAEAFLAEVHETRGGCLVVDVQLLGMSGTELQRRMAGAYWMMPVIAMSGAHDPLLEMEAMRLGARSFLRKPFDAKALLDAIARAVSERGERS